MLFSQVEMYINATREASDGAQIGVYRVVKEALLEWRCAVGTTGVTMNLEKEFRPRIDKFLHNILAAQLTDLARQSLKVDKFVPLGGSHLHSSSVVDIFTYFEQALEVLRGIDWPDENDRIRFAYTLKQTVLVTAQEYAQESDEIARARDAAEKSDTLLKKRRSHGRRGSDESSGRYYGIFLCIRPNDMFPRSQILCNTLPDQLSVFVNRATTPTLVM
jgi:hypothetical protein